MANTAEGITVGDQGTLDPNDPAGFEAIMASRGVPKEEGEESTPDRSIAGGLTVAGPEQQAGRDPETGRFISNQEVKTPPAATTPAATDTSGEGTGDLADDPEIQAVLAKYGNDPVKALKGLADAQALIGRRDEERESLKSEVAELRGMVQGIAAVGARPSAPAMTDEQVVETAATRVESLGYEGAATEAANVAHATGDERALSAVLEQWQMESPFQAMNFLTDFRMWQRDARAATTEPAATPDWQLQAEEQAKVATYGKGFETLRAELGEEAFAAVASKLTDALDEMPQNVLTMIDSPDAEARDAGFRIVADRALRLAAAAPAAPATPTQASIERKLTGARVATGALRPVPKEPETPTNREDAIKEFKRQIVEAPTTNIASGLTYGPQP